MKAVICGMLLGMAVLAGCGASEEEQVRSTTTDFVEAIVEGDGDRACDLMTGQARRDALAAAAFTGGDGCSGVMGSLRELFDDGELRALREFEIESVRIEGDRAEVTASESFDDEDEPTVLRKVEGEWLVDDEDGS
jgi:Domain of unknown function (DUF4878)